MIRYAHIPKVGLLVGLLLLSAAGCSKARGDDFSRFRPVEKLETAGQAPRRSLRYRAAPGEDAVYQLAATRTSSASKVRSRMRLRVALGLSKSTRDPSFQLRLLNVLHLEPSRPDAAPELGPAHVLLTGTLGPRGALDRLETSSELPSPVNLTLLAPLLLATYPDAKVGPGARWRVARRYQWRRYQAADSLTQRGGFDGRSDLLLRLRYAFVDESTKGDLSQVRLTAKIQGQLRSRTRTLGHLTHHKGTTKGSLKAAVDRTTGLPESVTIDLTGTYALKADDAKRSVTETIKVTLTRER